MRTKLYLSLILTVLLISGAFAWQPESFFATEDNDKTSKSDTFLGAPEYNPRDEFSLTQGGTNGLWNYGYSTSDTDNTLTLFNPATDADTIAVCNGSFERWRIANAETIPQIARYGPSEPCGNIPPNGLFIHPGKDNKRAVLRFTVPTSGTFQITGGFQKHVSGATSDLKIIKNGGLPGETVLYSGVIGAVYQQTFNFTATVTVGDKIDFSVGDDGDNTWQGDGSSITVTIGQVSNSCLPIPANLQVNVPAENSAVDIQSGNTNAQLVGDASYTNPGKVGRAFKFDGDGDYVRIEDNEAQRPTNAVTVEGWFKFNSTAGIVSLISKPVRNSALNSHTLYLENGELRGLIGNASQYTRAGSSFTPQTGVWHHLAFTYEMNAGISTLRVYANGVDVTSFVDGTPNLPLYYDANPYPLLIGGEFENNAPGFTLNGQADEVSVYGRALSSAEILDIVRHGGYGKCPQTNCAEPPNNLVSWYSGEQNALDSRSNNHGTLQNGTTFQAAKVGQGLKFDGSNDYVEIPDSSSLKPANLTVETWVKFDSLTSTTTGGAPSGYQNLVFKKNSRAPGTGFEGGYSLVKNPDNRLGLGFNSPGGGTDFANSTTIMQAGVWYHVVGTHDGTNIKLYVNGQVEGTGTATFPIDYGTTPLYFGSSQVPFGGYFSGVLDETSIYGRALSASEILTIYDAGQSGKCKPSPINPPANQVAWFTGDGDARNFTGLTTPGTLTGDTTYLVGKVGQSYKFDGNGDYVTTVDSSYWDFGTNDFAIEGWINTPSGTGVQRIISAGSQADGANNLWSLGYGDICAWGCGQRLNLAVFNGSGYADFSSNVVVFRPNTWHHVAVVRAGTSFTFYVDGVPAGTSPVGAGLVINGGTTGAILGARYNGTPSDRFEFANGMLDEISIYQRAVTASEIAAVYNAGVAGKVKAKPAGAGSNVQTQLADATVTYAALNTPGLTSQSGIDLGLRPALPSTATFTGLSWDISTTASYQNGTADDVRVCFNIPSLSGIPIAALRVLQLVGGSWVNRTAAGNTHSNFCTDNVSSLSQFVIVQDSGTQLYTVSGRVTNSNGFGISGVWVQLRDATTFYGNVPTDANGDYSWTNLVGGESYTLTPVLANNTFTPAVRSYPNVSANSTGADFVATPTSQCLVANYEFNDNLDSTSVAAPSLSYIGTGQTFATETVNGVPKRVLTYPGGNAVELRPTTGVIPSNQYEITIVTRFNQTYSYNRILDFKDGTTDSGLYVTSGQLIFLPGGSGGPTIPAGTYVEIKLTRTAAGIVKGYVNGAEQFSFNDNSGAAIISPANALRFFKDDGGENYGGAISKIQLSSGGCGSTNSIAGHIDEGVNNLNGVSVALSGGANATTTTDANGNYTFANLPSGLNYTVTPTLTNYAFTPPTRSFNGLAADVTDANFSGASTCTFTLSPDSVSFTSAGGSGSFNITTQPGCNWTAAASSNIAPWVTINGASTGTGNGTVNYTVAANTSILRYGDILINGGVTSHFIGQETGMGTCPTVSPIAYGTTLNGALAVSDCNLSGRYTDQFSFSGTAGDRVMIRLSSSDFAESLILHNTANTTIYTFTTGGAANDARVPNSFGFYTLPATGTYIISASNWGNGGSPTGNYSLTLHSDRTVPGVTPPSGLIGWYAGEGDTRNQQGSGVGTFNGTPTYSTDYVGQSFSLNGTDRYVEVPSASEPFNVSSLSVEAWVNTTTTNGDPNTATPKYRTIASKFNGAGGASWSLDMEQGGAIVFSVYDGTTTNYRAVRTSGAGAILAANDWKHVAATFDQTTQAISLYVNGADAGQLVAGSAASLSGIGQNTVPLRIGANQNGVVQGFWQGRLDEVSIYNRALSSTEITSIVDAGRIGKIKQATLSNQTSAALGSSTVTFGSPTSGSVTETPIDGSALPAPVPPGMGLQLAFDISTNAPFSGNATVCFAVPSVTPAAFADLKVYHFEGGAWVNRTAPNNVYPNLCAVTPSFSPFAIAAPLPPSAANVSISGRVTTPNGKGVRNAILTLSDPNGTIRRVQTGSFGYYSFDDVPGGESYVLTIHTKRFTFANPSRIVFAADDVSDADFVANE